ncbi:MAG: InlB B-repeat-containing protein [Marmoricola sp.]
MTKESSGTVARGRGRQVSAILAVVGLFLMSAGLSLVVEGTASAAPAKVHKSYVCKYVKTPGGGEVLQSGQNPIWVDNHALGVPTGQLAFVGETFNDGQIKSVVVVANTPKLKPEPSVSICPAAATTNVTPEVVFNNSVCVNGAATNPSWAGTNTADIDYAVTAGSVANGSPVTITATPKAGFTFPPGTTATFQHTFGPAATNCGSSLGGQVTAAGVLFQNPACPSNTVAANLGGSGFLTPAQWNARGNFIDLHHVTYTLVGNFAPGGTVNVAATADSGFTLSPSSASHWSHTFTAAANCNASGPAQHQQQPPTTIPKVIDSGFGSMGFIPGGPNSALYAWGYSLAGAGAALFLTALVVGRRRQTVS